jgi:opacity protein-like surface antigen
MKLAYLILASTALAASPAFAQSAPAANITPEQIAALQAQIQALQAQVNQLQTAQTATAAKVAAAPAAPKSDSSSWTKDTKISGKAFFNISSIDNERAGVNQSVNGTQTELKRFYLGVDHKFNNVLSANLTTDFRYGSNVTCNDVLVYV